MRSALMALPLLAASATVGAHPSFVETSFPAGSTAHLQLQIAHGCGDKLTHLVRVQLPNGEGVSAAVTQAKPRQTRDWLISTETGPVEPFSSHGTDHTQDVRAIRWLGVLPSDHYELFEFRVRLPNLAADEAPLELAFPVEQLCPGEGDYDWDGEDAPRITVRPPAPPS